MNIIEVFNLTKKYNDIKAVDNISFSVEKGSFFAFLGPNGAGKSTTINIISTLLKKDSGKVLICGKEVEKEDFEIRKKIGIVFQNSVLDQSLTIKENLLIRASFYKLAKKEALNKIDELSKLIGLDYCINRKYKNLSGGEKRKADILRALLNSPKLLILDEPTTGLDPKARKIIWEVINKLKKTKNLTIFLTTHYMAETDMCDNVIVINKGKIIAEGTPCYLKNKFSYYILKIVYKTESLKEKLNKKKIKYKLDRNVINIRLNNSKEGMKIINEFEDDIDNFEIIAGNMDDVFLNITEDKKRVII